MSRASCIGCEDCHELLDREWDGDELPSAERATRDEHVGSCAACKQYQLSMARMLNVTATLKDVEHERAFVLSPLVLRPRASRPFLAGVLVTSGVAAVFVLGLFLGGVFNASRSGVEQTQVVRLVVPAAKAKRVEVVGDFTGWKNRIALSPAENGLWVGEVKVTPGRYKYMIVIDGEALQPDPAAREVVDDGFGGKNSVLDVDSI